MNRYRQKQIKFRLSDEEALKLQVKIEQSGMSKQEYLVCCALDKPVTNLDGLKEVVPGIKKIGTNLNQIAKELNSKKYYNYNLITENQKELTELWQLVKQYLQKVE